MKGQAGFIREIGSGCVGALLALTYCLSYAALIFSGPLSSHLVAAVTAALIGCAVTGVVVGLGSGFRLAVSTPVSHTAAPLAVASAAMIPLFEARPDQAPGLALAMLMATAVLTGGLLLGLGQWRLGRLARYVPYPVAMGFLAATGWLIVVGAMRLAAGGTLSLAALADDGTPANLVLTLLWAAGLWLLSRRTSHFIALPLALAGVLGATHFGLFLAGMSTAQGQETGILLGAMTGEQTFLPVWADGFAGLDLDALLPFGGYMAAVAGMAVISVLLNATGMELASGESVDLDRELKVHGAANLIAGPLGGMLSHTSLSNSLLNRAAGGSGRLSALTVAAVAAAALFAGMDLLGFVPLFILSGLLLQLGLKLLWDWGWATRVRLPKRDWGVVILILLVTAVFGFLQGVVVGLIASCAIFALDASRVGVIRREAGLNEQPSIVARPAAEMQVLAAHGARVRVLKLDGFIFFGSAYGLVGAIEACVARKQAERVILDFSSVSGLDSSGMEALARLLPRMKAEGVGFVLAGNGDVAGLPALAGKLGTNLFDTLDGALQAAEEDVLRTHGGALSTERDLLSWLGEEFGDRLAAERLIAYLAPQPPRDVDGFLCRQGDPTDALFFVERGQVSVIASAGGENVPVRLFRAGTLLGEVGFFLNTVRTASLRAEPDARVWALTRENYERLVKEDQDVAVRLLSFTVRVQAERLAFTTRQNANLLASG